MAGAAVTIIDETSAANVLGSDKHVLVDLRAA